MRSAWERITVGLICLLMAGCSSSAARVKVVDIDPSEASSAAMEMYDKDGDDALAGDELSAVPGIKKYLKHYDRDGDNRVSRDEIAQRLEDWADQRLALHGPTVAVQLDGQWLEGATVKFVPEGYLGPNVKPAMGITMSNGFAPLTHDEEFLPKTANGRPLAGVTSGTFKVEITHPSRRIPARYNTATELGEEVAYDINESGDPIIISLKSS
jgi:hypothetical protein